MASNESVHTQIIEAIVESLKGISGDSGATYWYSPSAVVDVDWFEDSLLNAGYGGQGPLYAVRAGEEEHVEGASGSTTQLEVKAEMDVFILLLKPYTEDPNPFQQRNPSRRRVVDRLVRDVLRKLLADVQLLNSQVEGGDVENLFATPVIVDRDRWIENWAVAEIHFRTGYRYLEGTP